MENCHITLQDESGETTELPAEQMALIKAMIALGCVVVRIHRPRLLPLLKSRHEGIEVNEKLPRT